jgi:predicted HicB family RNase H-like nuclease
MFDPTRYMVAVRRVTEESEVYFRATVRELPDVEVFASSPDEAFNEALDVIQGLKDLADEHRKAFPEPLPEYEDVSGRVTLRLGKSLHQRAVIAAETDGISLNAFISNAVTAAVTRKDASLTKLQISEAMSAELVHGLFISSVSSALQDRVQPQGGSFTNMVIPGPRSDFH